MSGKYFIVDSVFKQYAEELLPYEVECRITRYDSDTQFRQNFLYDLAQSATSLNEHIKKRLLDWKAYIAWRRTSVGRKILNS